jgi:hypothetical protein
MKLDVRALLWAGGALAACAVVAAASVLLALSAVGVFATAAPAWTIAIPVAGQPIRVNAVGLVRLLTLPGIAHLLDGRAVVTRHGRLRFARDGSTLRIRCAPCRLHHAALAAKPVELRSLAVELRRTDDTVSGAVVIDAVYVDFDARLDTAGIDVAWRLPPTAFAALVGVLGDAVPEAAYARVDGTVQAGGTLALPSRRSRIEWSADGVEVGGLGTEPLQYGTFRFACAQRDGQPRLDVSGDGEKAWVAADAAGPYLAAAVLAAEDQRFYEHAGYDAAAVAAIVDGFDDGRPLRGGSTITQQLARTLFTGGERSIARKLRELLYAIEIERTLGKPRILELYLNTVDWGPGVCGAKAAARTYFGKSPARLTAIEAAWLAGALRSPHAAWERQFGARRADRERATLVLMQMRGWPRHERRRWAGQPLAFAPARSAAPRQPAAAAAGGRASASTVASK